VYRQPRQQQRRRHALPRQRQQPAQQHIRTGYGNLDLLCDVHGA